MNDRVRPPWAGWFRPRGGTWRQAVEAESEPEAWGMILAYAAGSGDKTVLPAGRHPDGPRPGPVVFQASELPER